MTSDTHRYSTAIANVFQGVPILLGAEPLCRSPEETTPPIEDPKANHCDTTNITYPDNRFEIQPDFFDPLSSSASVVDFRRAVTFNTAVYYSTIVILEQASLPLRDIEPWKAVCEFS